MLEKSNSTSDIPIPLDGVFAVVGCDGTGKTTLTADLLANLGENGPTKRRYMGLISGEMRNIFLRIPPVNATQ